MAKGKDPHSLRNEFGDSDFDILTPGKYVELLEIKVGRREGDRAQAKEQLFNASFRLIEKQVREVLRRAQAKAGFEQTGIGLEGRSDLFNAMAETVWNDFSKMAAKAAEHDVSLFTIIANRVAHRLFSRFRREGADKRSAEFDAPEVLADLSRNSVEGLEELLRTEFHTEFLAAVEDEELDETAREVMKAFYFGIVSGQHLPIARIAESLGIPASTAKSALQRAKEHLQSRLGQYVNS